MDFLPGKMAGNQEENDQQEHHVDHGCHVEDQRASLIIIWYSHLESFNLSEYEHGVELVANSCCYRGAFSEEQTREPTCRKLPRLVDQLDCGTLQMHPAME